MPESHEYQITGDTRPYHFTAPNPAVATVLVLMIGDGRLGWQDLRWPEHELPVFRIPQMRDHWAKQNFDMPLKDVLKKVSTNAELVTALHRSLESVTLGLPGDSGIDQPQEYRDLRIKAQQVAAKLKQSIRKGIRRSTRTH